MKKIQKGDVYWFLPKKKKPFAYSTVATSYLIECLYEEYKDLRLVYENINYDEDAKKIVKTLIDNKVFHLYKGGD